MFERAGGKKKKNGHRGFVIAQRPRDCGYTHAYNLYIYIYRYGKCYCNARLRRRIYLYFVIITHVLSRVCVHTTIIIMIMIKYIDLNACVCTRIYKNTYRVRECVIIIMLCFPVGPTRRPGAAAAAAGGQRDRRACVN